MSNMAYCRFRNTLPDLRDCFQALNEMNNLDDLSKDEVIAATKLIALCDEIAKDWADEVVTSKG